MYIAISLSLQPIAHYTLASIYLSLKDYVASSLHLRAALHSQPQFEHAFSALKLVRCSLKFKEEQQYLQRQVGIWPCSPAFQSLLTLINCTHIHMH